MKSKPTIKILSRSFVALSQIFVPLHVLMCVCALTTCTRVAVWPTDSQFLHFTQYTTPKWLSARQQQKEKQKKKRSHEWLPLSFVYWQFSLAVCEWIVLEASDSNGDECARPRVICARGYFEARRNGKWFVKSVQMCDSVATLRVLRARTSTICYDLCTTTSWDWQQHPKVSNRVYVAMQRSAVPNKKL